MKFSSSAGYETLGKCFLEGKIEEISHLKLTEIQGMFFKYYLQKNYFIWYWIYDKGIFFIGSIEMVLIVQAQSEWVRLAVN